MNRLFAFAFLSAISLTVSAQEGDFFVTHFSPTLNQEEQTYFDLIFKDTDELIAANRAGIVTFDGKDWDLIRTPSAPLSLALDEQMNLYVGCADDFGRITVIEGQYRFESLGDESNQGLTPQVIQHQNKIYYIQGYGIHEFDVESATLTTYPIDSSDTYFTHALIYNKALWVFTTENHYYLEGELQKGEPILPDGSMVLHHARNAQSGNMAMAGNSGRVFVYQDGFTEIAALEGLSISDISWVSEELLAVSTLADGIYFYSISNGEITAKMDNSNGLLDNEIFAIATDGSSGLWVAHTFGFSRVDPQLPIRSFNHYPGLDGNLTTALYLDNTWNIATSNGIYTFDQLDNYKNIVYYVPKKDIRQQARNVPVAKPQTEEEDEKKGIKLFSKRKDDEQPTLKSKILDKPIMAQLKSNITGVFQPKEDGLLSRVKLPLPKNNKIQYERRVRKELVSTQFLYKKLPDVSEKIKLLVEFEGSIIASTPAGILEIQDGVAEEIFNEPIRYVYHPKNTQSLWISTQNGEVLRLEKVQDVWIEIQSVDTGGELVLSMLSDQEDRIWMAGANELLDVMITDSISTVVDRYPLNNQFFDNIRITEVKNVLHLINNQGIFTLDTMTNMLEMDEELMSSVGQPLRHLIQSDGRVWVHNGDNWNRIEFDGTVTKLNYLKLFPKMTFIEQVGEELWLIDDHESLFKFTPSASDSIAASQMYFRSVSSPAGILPMSENKFDLVYEENSISVRMARPDFLDLVNVEYQYRMKELSDQWSSWSPNNELSFNYLPAGKYSLEVRSRDAFGRVQTADVLSFNIKPPYWQTTWFSALQVIFFTALVLIASRLNRQDNESKKLIILSNLLTVVTIVMIIELLQNIAESYFGELGSPVLAFGLDVFVALLIFPVEMLLRKIVTGAEILPKKKDQPQVTP